MSLFSENYQDQVNHILSKIEKQLAKKDYFSASFSYQALAGLAEEKGEIEDAIKYTQLSAEYSLKENKFHTAGWQYKALAELHFKNRGYSKAIEYAVKSAELLLREKNIYAAQWSYNLAAKAAQAQGEFYTAIRFYKKSLELEKDLQVMEEIEKLKKNIPHPIVLEYVDKKEVKEGELVEFTLSIENNSHEVLKNIKILDRQENILDEIQELLPSEEKRISFNLTGRPGFLRPAYKKLLWKNVHGDIFGQEIKSVGVKVKPNVEVLVSCHAPFRLDKPSDFIVLAKNNSISQIKNAEFSAKFPDSLKVKPKTKAHFEMIGPGEEKGAVFSVTPLVVGESAIKDITIMYTDEFGTAHQEVAPPFILREVVEQKPFVKEKGPEIENRLKNMETKKHQLNLSPHPISEEEYVKLTKSYECLEKGFSLAHISLDHLTSHILDACEPMALISSHKFEEERLFLFSGIDLDAICLLTIAIQKGDGLLNILFKAYSDKKEAAEKILESVSEIIAYSSMILSSAKEVEKIEVNQVIKIIDSIVQRSQIGVSYPKTKKEIIENSIIQRVDEI